MFKSISEERKFLSDVVKYYSTFVDKLTNYVEKEQNTNFKERNESSLNLSYEHMIHFCNQNGDVPHENTLCSRK